MNLQPQLHVALKEWAIVCSALERRRQILLLRKGGIHESEGVFQLEHPQFLLFPTYLHQNREMLKPQEQGGLQVLTAEPQKITLSAAGVVSDILQIRSRAAMDALEDQHIWTKPLIDMRFNYKPQNPLYLLLVRTYRLAQSITVINTPEYAGCKSWVPLREAVATTGAIPVLDEGDYQERRRKIAGLVKE